MKLDNRGFSALEVLVAMAILTIGMFAAADAMILNARYQRTSTSESDITQVFDQVQSIAGSEWSCTAGLAGSNYTAAITVKDPVTAQVVASEGLPSPSGNFWRVSQVRMTGVQAVPGQPGVLRGSLALQASKNMVINLGVPSLSRSIPDIYFEINPDNTIARCYTTSDTMAAAQSTCQLLGGIWNGTQCRLAGG